MPDISLWHPSDIYNSRTMRRGKSVLLYPVIPNGKKKSPNYTVWKLTFPFKFFPLRYLILGNVKHEHDMFWSSPSQAPSASTPPTYPHHFPLPTSNTLFNPSKSAQGCLYAHKTALGLEQSIRYCRPEAKRYSNSQSCPLWHFSWLDLMHTVTGALSWCVQWTPIMSRIYCFEGVLHYL
jgi:hypothetical protein